MLQNLIVPVLNRYDLLEQMLESIDYPVKHLLVIDNGGMWNNTVDNHNLKKITVLNMPSNLGVADSWNLGIKCFPHDKYWSFTSNDVTFNAGALERMSNTKEEDVILSSEPPFWQTFSIGEDVIKKTGLFCSQFYPAYMEDTDFQRRLKHFGFSVQRILDVNHLGTMTASSDPSFANREAYTLALNMQLNQMRVRSGDMTDGHWDLERRRMLEWVDISTPMDKK